MLMRFAKWLIPLLVWMLAFAPTWAHAAEGDPLLSVDDLLSLEDSYEAFLKELEDLIVSRGLLSESDRAAWHDAQMGDFFQNGGYGSILATYLPGALSYTREEDTLLTLGVQLQDVFLELVTMRRYTPQDSSLPGLMLTLDARDASGAPLDVHFTLTSSSGVFLKWDALLGAYSTAGAMVESDGETIVWSDQTPAANARSPVITVTVTDARTQALLGEAALLLTVDGTGYLVNDGALSAAEEPAPSASPALPE